MPIKGAVELWDHLCAESIPTVLLTNTGERSATEISEKFERVLRRTVHPRQVCTALDHLAAEMQKKTACGFHVCVIASETNVAWRQHEFAKRASLFTTAGEIEMPYCFALFSDGNVAFYYDVLVEVSRQMTRDRVHLFASSADEALAMVAKNGESYRVPGPGLFLHCLSQLLPESDRHLIVPLGKGNDKTLAEHAISMLQGQGFAGRNSDVFFVGDRLNTDVRAALQIGGTAVHVQSGCHKAQHYADFPSDSPHVVATDVSDLSLILARKGAGRLHDIFRDSLVTTCHQAWRGDLGPALATTASTFRLHVPPRRASSFPENLHGLATFWRRSHDDATESHREGGPSLASSSASPN